MKNNYIEYNKIKMQKHLSIIDGRRKSKSKRSRRRKSKPRRSRRRKSKPRRSRRSGKSKPKRSRRSGKSKPKRSRRNSSPKNSKVLYGEFKPEERFINQFSNKEVVTPAGYSGLFVGRVYDSRNILIPDADTYFWNLDQSVGKLGDDSIDKDLHSHLAKKWHPLESVSSKYGYQAGFGGDEGSGLIDFFLKKQMPCPPDMKFKVHNKNYVMKFRYSEPQEF